MVSSAVVAVLLAAVAQAAYGSPSCGLVGHGHGHAYGHGLVGHGLVGHGLVGHGIVGHGVVGHGIVGHGHGYGHGHGHGHGCHATALVHTPVVTCKEHLCPGKVVETDVIVNKPVTEHFSYSVPHYSHACAKKPAGVARSVHPHSWTSPTVCDTKETHVTVPTTDVEVRNEPLCKKTCTTSQYMIQIPVVETTCHSHPLCKKTVRAQDHSFTTVSKKTTCANTHCTQNKISETPLSETVCQGFKSDVHKVGSRTWNKQEVIKTCHQLPPVKCCKPVLTHHVTEVPVHHGHHGHYAHYGHGHYAGYGHGHVVGHGHGHVVGHGHGHVVGHGCSCY